MEQKESHEEKKQGSSSPCCYIHLGVFCDRPVVYKLPVGEGYTYVCEYHAGMVGGDLTRLEEE